MLIVTMEKEAGVKQIGAVLKKFEELEFTPHITRGEQGTKIGCMIDSKELRERLEESLAEMEGVLCANDSDTPYRLGGSDFSSGASQLRVGETIFGGEYLGVIAGPCAVESYDQMSEIAEFLSSIGLSCLRGGAFKPRTSPYSFQGLGKKGLELLSEMRRRWGLKIVTECLSPSDVELVAEYADVIQVGARNMQNFALLQELGKIRKPVLLKRGMMNSLKELLLSSEYILSNGNSQVMLCERGIRTFETETRNTLDISAVPVLKKHTHLPVVVDPSHAAGERSLVPAMTLAAVASGADGLIIETHPSPPDSISDADQAMYMKDFQSLLDQVKKVAQAVGKKVL